MEIFPSVGFSSLASTLPKVDLPHPLSPMSPKISPPSIEKLTLSTA